MSSLESMIESLVADDPRRSADRLLSRLCAVTGADGGAVLVPSGDNASVFLTYKLPLSGLGSLQTRFQDHRFRLAKADFMVVPGFALAAVGADVSRPRGWVYLENPRNADPRELKPFLLGMAKALDAEPAAEPAAGVGRSEANRAGILRLLEANDWNIARVSRDLGVTRRTLYMRLAAFGIERKKVPRLAKPLTA